MVWLLFCWQDFAVAQGNMTNASESHCMNRCVVHCTDDRDDYWYGIYERIAGQGLTVGVVR
jgi:hypothetical protein